MGCELSAILLSKSDQGGRERVVGKCGRRALCDGPGGISVEKQFYLSIGTNDEPKSVSAER
jgi:hypothetical protein